MTFCIGLAVVDHTGGVTCEGAVTIVHGAPLGVIEGVERIRAELQLTAFAERSKGLLQSRIPVVDSRLAKVVAAFVTVSHREVRLCLDRYSTDPGWPQARFSKRC